MSYQVPFP